MSRSRFSTSVTFRSRDRADLFVAWLRDNINDADYGAPAFEDLQSNGAGWWIVTFSAATTFALGVATGIGYEGPKA